MTQTETLLRYAEAGREYRWWYADAQHAIAVVCQRKKWDQRVFAEVMALTSPRVQVGRNWSMTYHYMQTGKHLPGTMRTIKAAVEHWEETGEIRGRKTEAFARALKGDETALVLDVWMAVALGVDPVKVTRPDNMLSATRRVVRIADVLDWTVAQTQAAIWCGIILTLGGSPARFELAADGNIKLHTGTTKPLFGD
ncbi:MAG: hypothetical protein M0P95_17955 [Sulfuritalea sp.]|jgi:hypothetical protein|nr:hypothetical protein [Sulfuritalea sp.]